MIKVTSAEIQNRFGRIRAKALKEPVIITNHGRDDLALISAEEYMHLRELEQQAFYVHELPDEVIDEIGSLPISEDTKQFDHEYTVE